ncbi:MAG: ATP-dependent Clp protease ATP-binding subunit [Patescibacteria group bacterium]|nr:ATP-dependent Clp protease ATP-binding subunit [Patescibacteria group bacterium]
MNLDTLNKFTTHLKNTLLKAADLAQEWGHPMVNPEHLIYSLTLQRGSLASEILNKLGLKKELAKEIILAKNLPVKTDHLPSHVPGFSETVKNALVKASGTANQYQHKYIGTEHLLHALVQQNSPVVNSIFQGSQMKPTGLQEQLQTVLKSTSKFPDLTEIFDKPTELQPADGVKTQTPALDFFCSDLTSEKMQKKIDPVIGRSREIERLIHILSRRTKNNPVLIGDPGVGKTAIVEGLAKKILNQEVPDILLNKRILSLDLGLVIAGTIYRGEFEARFKQIIDEIKKDPNIVLFIDELHTIIGTGGATGTLDAANILKPALSKGDIRCIGATTLDEYRKHIESDPALERRFQPILVEEASPEETLEVLRGIKKNYETFHQVNIADEALQAAVKLSQRYLQEKCLPDKAIDLIDEAASKFKVMAKRDSSIKEIIKIEREIEKLERKKRSLVTKEQFSLALRLKTQQELLRQRLSVIKEKQRQEQKFSYGQITEKEVAEVVSRITQVPLNELLKEEKTKLLNLEKILSRRVIGQSEAVSTVSQFIRRSRAGLAPVDRPIGSFMFLGPSGVGKTELAKVIAEEVYEDKNALIRLDMSEFSESFQISKLIGAPAGYVGYKEGNKLTEAVRRKPYSVILFDEIEKAHRDVFNLLLQVLEDGHLTDAVGKKVNFKNTTIIMTSNIGIAELNRLASMGFQADKQTEELDQRYNQMKEEILKDLKKSFRPEFLNRLDKIIVFRPLTKKDIEKIVELQLKEFGQRLQAQNLTFEPTKDVIKYIAKKGFQPDEGARAIRKIIQDEIENLIAESIITGRLSKGSPIILEVKNKAIILKQ